MAYKAFWFRNEERDSEGRHLGFFGYRPGHKMVLAYNKALEFETCRPIDALEGMFRTFNIEHPADYRNRSMSVGDVCVLINIFGWMAFRCASFGWERIDGGKVDGIEKADVLMDLGMFDLIQHLVDLRSDEISMPLWQLFLDREWLRGQRPTPDGMAADLNDTDPVKFLTFGV